MVAAWETTLAETDDRRVASQYDLGGVYYFNGQMKQAIYVLGRVVAIYKETQTEMHRDRLHGVTTQSCNRVL